MIRIRRHIYQNNTSQMCKDESVNASWSSTEKDIGVGNWGPKWPCQHSSKVDEKYTPPLVNLPARYCTNPLHSLTPYTIYKFADMKM